MASDDRLTPARRQYLQLKRRHPDALLLYRMGDFYELFDDDAVVAARDLHITLTSREFGKGNRVPMAGVPHHALASYLRRLLAKGHRVAIGEQLSEPGHGLVDRDVVRVLSPGTVTEPGLLAARENNYLAALNPGREGTGLAYVDVSTGEFGVTEFAAGDDVALAAELSRLGPAECLVPEGRATGDRVAVKGDLPVQGSGTAARQEAGDPVEADPVARRPLPAATPLTVCPPRWFHEGPARDRLLRHFRVASLEPFGCEGLPLATGAAAAVLAYVEGTNRELLRLLRSLHTYTTGGYVALDAHTRRNLELTRAARSGDRAGSLLGALDRTRTAMGGRLLRRWLSRPLRDVDAINRRLDVVEALAQDHDRRADVAGLLERTGDLERLAGRARQGTASVRDMLALAAGLRAAGEIAEGGSQIVGPRMTGSAVADLLSGIDPASDVAELIERAVSDEDGRLVRRGFDPELDELTAAVASAQQTLLEIERKERERSGIRSLKVGFNKVFGYYIEVSRANLKSVPSDFIRRQTLANGERYVTPELKEWEARVLRAEERIEEHERRVFAAVLETAGGQVDRLLATARALSELDVLATFAELAVTRRYARPILDSSGKLAIEDGRHPVVELSLDDGAFVANDTRLEDLSPQPPPLQGEGERDFAQQTAGSTTGDSPPPWHGQGGREGEVGRLLLITGPNMAGKSTYLRQVALIVLLAQVGCFVPARAARIGVVDRIFTRVGAQDDLAAGASTFLVEMVETAAILRHATERSLLIFDEIGRGTSTFDGLAIAQAVVEDVHDRIRARTLFATHFHELTALAQRLPAMRNYNVAAIEEAGRVVFLRRVIPGGADRSYGIHVARLAGLPEHVTQRAEVILADLEMTAAPAAPRPLPSAPSPQREEEHGSGVAPAIAAHLAGRGTTGGEVCPTCAAAQSRLLAELRAVNLAATTPIQALNLLFALQERLADSSHCTCGQQPARPRLAVVEPPRAVRGMGPPP